MITGIGPEKIWAVIPAAGTGSRMMEALKQPEYDDIRRMLGQPQKKQFIHLGDKELLVYTLEAFQNCPSVSGIVLVTGKEDLTHCKDLVASNDLDKVKKIIPGGSRRQESVLIGLSSLPKDCTMAVIHDGARPFIDIDIIEKTIEAAARSGGAIAAVPVKDTIKIVSRGKVESTPDRSRLYSAQTPQAFRYPDILEGYRHAAVMGDFRCTDDAQVMEKYMDTDIEIVEGSYENIKITTPDDLKMADQILRSRQRLEESRA
ncbi:MAG TPA: 2-C-methyl-D-erythritol 4-phosphate cytidylyltransferase [Lachnospiraceae bacterium]|jgi:2-C-methyl-D-erythritol 4-phosphate cytidylyltransferase|nr:2-C-methyl-D-erythritol 4-phosphate cytidylyltransferase [Lachnospiraceae bacterium]